MQIANFTVADAAATPVTHTFTASTVENGIATWYNKGIASHPIGYEMVSVSLGRPSANGRQSYRPVMKYVSPVLVTETINGVSVPKTSYVNRADVSLSISPDSTLQERKNFRKKLYGMLDSIWFKDVTEELNPVYG